MVTKLLVLAWVGIFGVFGADLAGVPGAFAPARALLNYRGGFISPVSVLGAITALWVVVDWRLGVAKRGRARRAILREKPGLANDAKALERERKIRAKEAKLQRQEERALTKGDRVGRPGARAGRREGKRGRKREGIEVKERQLQSREQPGRR